MQVGRAKTLIISSSSARFAHGCTHQFRFQMHRTLMPQSSPSAAFLALPPAILLGPAVFQAQARMIHHRFVARGRLLFWRLI